MSTEPSGWQTPKTNWTTADPVGNGDLNRIEGNINAIDLGNRTVDDAQVPSSDTGTLREFLDWLANRLKAITGKTNWFDTPADTIENIIATLASLSLDDILDGATYKRVKSVNASHEIVDASVASNAAIATQKLKANVSNLNTTQVIGTSGSWVPPKGFYMFMKELGSTGYFQLQLYDGSTWKTTYSDTGPGPSGCFFFDGVNQRCRNGSGTDTLTIRYHKFD
jgi:hypothetical protein